MNIESVFDEVSQEWSVEIVSETTATLHSCKSDLLVRARCVESLDSLIPDNFETLVKITSGNFEASGVVWNLLLSRVGPIYTQLTSFYTSLQGMYFIIEFLSKSEEEFDFVLAEAKNLVVSLHPANLLIDQLSINGKRLSYSGWQMQECGDVIRLLNKSAFCSLKVRNDFDDVLAAVLGTASSDKVMTIPVLSENEPEQRYVLYNVVDQSELSYLQLLLRWGVLFISYGREYFDLREVFCEKCIG